MNKPLVFGLIIGAEVTGALAYGYGCMGSLGREVYILLALTLGPAGSALWLVLRRTKEPDVLAELGFDYCEREGFWFAAAPVIEDGASYLIARTTHGTGPARISHQLRALATRETVRFSG